MSYILFADRTTEFRAKVNIKGASLKESFARLLVETPEWNLVFNGEIQGDGTVVIPVKKLRKLFGEGDTGSLKLEVVADGDAYFTPWTSDFHVIASRQASAVVAEQKVSTKPSVTAQVEQKPSYNKNHLKEYTRRLIKKGVTLENLTKNRNVVSKITQQFLRENPMGESEINWIVENTLLILTKRRNK